MNPQRIIFDLINKGEVKRPRICSACGEYAYIVAHHPDYASPYWIIWLCRPCHKKLHQQCPAQNRDILKPFRIIKKHRNNTPNNLQFDFNWYPFKNNASYNSLKTVEINQISALLPDFD
jgi:hypothetical protein